MARQAGLARAAVAGLGAGTRAAVYARLSQDRTGDAESVDEQVRKATAYALAQGWQMVGTYADRNRSASQYARGRREEYEQMLADLDDGAFDVIVVAATDRLYRRPRELEDLIDRTDQVPIHAVRSGPLDLTSPEGKTQARIYAAINAGESDKTAARVRDGMARIASAGHANGGGTRLYGYRTEEVPDPSAKNGTRRVRVKDMAEATVVTEMAERLLAGDTMAGIARDLNGRGLTTATGKAWTSTSIKSLMGRSALAGLREHNGATVRAAWEPVLSVEDHERLKRRLGQHASPGRPATYPGSGVLLCHACERPLIGKRSPRGARQYACDQPGCRRTVITADVEEWLRDTLRDAVASGAIRRMLRERKASDDRGKVLDDIADVEGLLAELGDDRDAGLIGRPEYLRRAERLQARLSAARASLGRLTRSAAVGPLSGTVGEFDAAWAAATPARQRAILRAAFRVWVGPARRGLNRFDDDRLSDPEWLL